MPYAGFSAADAAMKAEEYRSRQQANALNAAQYDETMREIAQRKKVEDAARASGGDMENFLNNPDYIEADPVGAITNKADYAAQLRELKDKDFEVGIKRIEALGRILGTAKDQASYDNAVQQARGLLGDEAVAGVPPTYDPAYVQNAMQSVLSAKEQLDLARQEREFKGTKRRDQETRRHNRAQERRPTQGANKLVAVYDPESPTGRKYVKEVEAAGSAAPKPAAESRAAATPARLAQTDAVFQRLKAQNPEGDDSELWLQAYEKTGASVNAQVASVFRALMQSQNDEYLTEGDDGYMTPAEMYAQAGEIVKGQKAKASGRAAGVTPPADTTAAGRAPARPSSRAEYDALPPGARYIDSNGRTRQKSARPKGQ